MRSPERVSDFMCKSQGSETGVVVTKGGWHPARIEVSTTTIEYPLS
jgi:hypothetical protein